MNFQMLLKLIPKHLAIVTVAIAALTTPRGLFAQDSPTMVLHVESRLVQTPVRFEKPPGNVDKAKFEVLVDGKKQNLKRVDTETTKLNVVISVDVSGSVESYIGKLADTAQDFVNSLPPSASVSLVSFSDQVTQLVGFDENRAAVGDALRKLKGGGSTRAFDSVAYAVDGILKEKSGESNIVIVITDGGENSSQVDFEKLRKSTQSTSTLIFPVLFDKQMKDQWGQLAESSGGKLIMVRNTDDINKGYEAIRKLLDETYVLSFYANSSSLPSSPRFYPMTVSYDGSTKNIQSRPWVCLNKGPCTYQGTPSYTGPKTLAEAKSSPFLAMADLTPREILGKLQSGLVGTQFRWTDSRTLELSPQNKSYLFSNSKDGQWTTDGTWKEGTDFLVVGVSPTGKGVSLKNGTTFEVSSAKVGIVPCRSAGAANVCSTDDGGELYFAQLRFEMTLNSGETFTLACQWPRASLDPAATGLCENMILQHATEVSP